MKKRILVLYNLAEKLEKGIATDLICEQEIKIIVPLVVQLLKNRGYQAESMKALSGKKQRNQLNDINSLLW